MPKGYKLQTEFNHILTNFSPVSKKRNKIPSMPQDDEIDILIATDCISEGQNLQDCDYLVNYDIHWNPVKIIQRFGRIDRIGSINEAIQLVNFWPTDDLNKYINLKNRVEARMALVDIAATTEDNILNTEAIKELIKDDLKYRDKQLLRLKDEVLDLEDLGESVTLNEFTLDDFRIEAEQIHRGKQEGIGRRPAGFVRRSSFSVWRKCTSGRLFQIGEGNERPHKQRGGFLSQAKGGCLWLREGKPLTTILPGLCERRRRCTVYVYPAKTDTRNVSLALFRGKQFHTRHCAVYLTSRPTMAII